MSGKSAIKPPVKIGIATKAVNGIAKKFGYMDRVCMSTSVRDISSIFPDQKYLSEILIKHEVLKSSFSGDLSSVQPKDFIRFTDIDSFKNAL